jgi:hypothetical protein
LRLKFHLIIIIIGVLVFKIRPYPNLIIILKDLGIKIKVDKMVDANTLETTLKNQQWVGGQTPTSADREAFEALKS